MDVRRAECQIEPSGANAAQARGRDRNDRGHYGGTLAGDDGQHLGHPEGRRSVFAD
uniref:hypothetical protein n=1 Tax=Paenibacillus sp. IHBB 10380 TaxID=1566358 RepID=UPI001F42B172|nr:hypothetical protein [Paenibacillus sp. IHBB 10380]